MGVFGKSNKEPKQQSGATIIANGTFIKGGIDTKGSVHIDGKFEGGIMSNETITVGQNGEVYADVRSKNLIVSGFLDGVINAENVHILSTGKIIGKMSYKNLTIEPGGVFDGEGKVKNSTLVSKYHDLQIDSTITAELIETKDEPETKSSTKKDK
jgi:cytoskeletal protein CcmA (bactofilin family)